MGTTEYTGDDGGGRPAAPAGPPAPPRVPREETTLPPFVVPALDSYVTTSHARSQRLSADCVQAEAARLFHAASHLHTLGTQRVAEIETLRDSALADAAGADAVRRKEEQERKRRAEQRKRQRERKREADVSAAGAVGRVTLPLPDEEEDTPEVDDADDPSYAEGRKRRRTATSKALASAAQRADFDTLGGVPGAPRADAATVAGLEQKLWTQIARRDVPRAAKLAQQMVSSRQFYCKRVSFLAAREGRRHNMRTKTVKEMQARTRRLARETLFYLKDHEKREKEQRKREEKEAQEQARKAEEILEKKRQARKLNFLITQTELYSHFIGNKLADEEGEGETERSEADGGADLVREDGSDTVPNGSGDGSDAHPAGVKRETPPDAENPILAAALRVNADLEKVSAEPIDFNSDENVAMHARLNAQKAFEQTKKAAAEFDERAGNGLDELNFQNPSMAGAETVVEQPSLLTCQLKEYQLKGLSWLANLYDQGINGILADEMGLGKTVQSISLMAHLAEKHNIWGPFLVIAPASTLHNWQQEITRFVPGLKALPYWGNTKDRATLRKFWNRKSLRYTKDSPFHVLVTSYQLVVQDEKYFQGVKWQYMVLDEAQAIKSSSSARWKTLLNFKCRNRLLLTGTPIQNSMHELWALLHFIMPTLFDSHDEFSEWFSKDIETSADNKGNFNAHQLKRLHMILKPFMLRRIKKHVQNELVDKIEIDLYCDLTPRQKKMYRLLRDNLPISELISRSLDLRDENSDSVKRLMNLIMQFRKVCNHPELFERADVKAPYAFVRFNGTANLRRDNLLDAAGANPAAAAGDAGLLPYATHSAIEYVVPRMLHTRCAGAARDRAHVLHKTLALVGSTAHITRASPLFFPLLSKKVGLRLSASEVHRVFAGRDLLNVGWLMEQDRRRQAAAVYDELVGGGAGADEREAGAGADASLLDVPPTNPVLEKFVIRDTLAFPAHRPVLFNDAWREKGLVPLDAIEPSRRRESILFRPEYCFWMPHAVARAVEATSTDRSFVEEQRRLTLDDDVFSDVFYGVPLEAANDASAVASYENAEYPGYNARGVLNLSEPTQLALPTMQVPSLGKLILDSGKLATLDALLVKLKAEGHRCLIYFQMTRMIDLMEEYLAFRQYRYLRLDGSSSIGDRRDMVSDWQTKDELFIFLLSTRAGGLGINLTAADTVIFYDSDWNPSNDAQAMDRAHRLGQTKQVTVYRLITKDTVDERIVQLARKKKTVQDAVVGSSSGTASVEGAGATSNAKEVVSLLLDDEELAEGIRQADLRRKRDQERAIEGGRRSAKIRMENRKQQLLQQQQQQSQSTFDDDDDDAFSFFLNQTNTVVEEETSAAASPAPVNGVKKRPNGSADGAAKKRRR